MAIRTTRRQTFSVNYKLKNLRENVTTIAEFNGISDDRNEVVVNQQTFSDAQNVFVDEDSVLLSRPPLKFNDNDANIIKEWRFGKYAIRSYRHFIEIDDACNPILDEEGNFKYIDKIDNLIVNGKYLKVSFNVADIESIYVSPYIKLSSLPTPSKVGYNFYGWYTDEECTERFDINLPIIHDVLLYAKFVLSTYIVILDDNYEGGERREFKLNYKEFYPYSNNERNGYYFDGWYTDKECTERFQFFHLEDDKPILKTVDENITLYAKWVTSKTGYYTVIFQENNGTPVSPQFITPGDLVIEPTGLNISVREGYTFVAWYLNSTFRTKYTFKTAPTSNLTLYARWSQNTYRVSFMNEGVVYKNVSVKYDNIVAAPDTPTKDGYVFGGWYADEDYTIPFDFDEPIKGNLTLYAKWIADESQVSLFNDNTDKDFYIGSLISLVCYNQELYNNETEGRYNVYNYLYPIIIDSDTDDNSLREQLTNLPKITAIEIEDKILFWVAGYDFICLNMAGQYDEESGFTKPYFENAAKYLYIPDKTLIVNGFESDIEAENFLTTAYKRRYLYNTESEVDFTSLKDETVGVTLIDKENNEKFLYDIKVDDNIDIRLLYPRNTLKISENQIYKAEVINKNIVLIRYTLYNKIDSLEGDTYYFNVPEVIKDSIQLNNDMTVWNNLSSPLSDIRSLYFSGDGFSIVTLDLGIMAYPFLDSGSNLELQRWNLISYTGTSSYFNDDTSYVYIDYETRDDVFKIFLKGKFDGKDIECDLNEIIDGITFQSYRWHKLFFKVPEIRTFKDIDLGPLVIIGGISKSPDTDCICVIQLYKKDDLWQSYTAAFISHIGDNIIEVNDIEYINSYVIDGTTTDVSILNYEIANNTISADIVFAGCRLTTRAAGRWLIGSIQRLHFNFNGYTSSLTSRSIYWDKNIIIYLGSEAQLHDELNIDRETQPYICNKNNGKVLSSYSIFDEDNKIIDYPFSTDKDNKVIPLWFENKDIYLIYDNQLWTNVLGTDYSIYIDKYENLIDGKLTISKNIPDCSERLKDYYFGISTRQDGYNRLEVSQAKRDEKNNFLLYLPISNEQRFGSKITNICHLADDTLGIFTENEIYYISLVTVNDQLVAKIPVKSKLVIGCKDGSDVKISVNGQSILMMTQRGIVALTSQDFVATTDRVITYLSDNIQGDYDKFYNEVVMNVFAGSIKPMIKITNYRYWTMFYKYMDRTILIYDVRNGAWWKWKTPYPIKQILATDDLTILMHIDYPLNFDVNNVSYESVQGVAYLLADRVFELYGDDVLVDTVTGSYDFTGEAYEYVNPMIDWYICSQKLHFGQINNYKTIKSLNISANGDDVFTAKLSTKVYRDLYHPQTSQVIEVKINDLRTFIYRTNLMHLMNFQYMLENDKRTKLVDQQQLALNAISIKYEIKEMIR